MESYKSVTVEAPAVSADKPKGKKKSRGSQKGGEGAKQSGVVDRKGAGKLRGLPKDSPEVRLSKTISWLLRHGAKSEGLAIRSDGYVKVSGFLDSPKLKSTGLTLEQLQEIVKADAKQRYDLRFENNPKSEDPKAGEWWIKANQGHSIKAVKLELKPIHAVSDIPTGIAVHGTARDAWKLIEKQGLSKMTRNHIHLAQGVAGDNVISGMRKQSQILVFVNVQKALDAGLKFFLSENGVVLTEGNENGILKPEFFDRVEDAKRKPLPGWEGSGPTTTLPISVPVSSGFDTPSSQPTQGEVEKKLHTLRVD